LPIKTFYKAVYKPGPHPKRQSKKELPFFIALSVVLFLKSKNDLIILFEFKLKNRKFKFDFRLSFKQVSAFLTFTRYLLQTIIKDQKQRAVMPCCLMFLCTRRTKREKQEGNTLRDVSASLLFLNNCITVV
jgi:hypothetical protein